MAMSLVPRSSTTILDTKIGRGSKFSLGNELSHQSYKVGGAPLNISVMP